MGIGSHTRIENAIIDKNARIGSHVTITPSGKPDNVDHAMYYIRDGVVIIPKNGVVPDGTTREPAACGRGTGENLSGGASLPGVDVAEDPGSSTGSSARLAPASRKASEVAAGVGRAERVQHEAAAPRDARRPSNVSVTG
jgi:hypothetical protein